MSRLSKNILSNLAGQAGVALVSFIAVKFVFARLGADGFGLIFFTLTLNSVLSGLTELGMSAVVLREVAAHLRHDPDYVRDLLRTATTIFWGAYILLAVAIYLGAPVLAGHWIHLQNLDPATARRVVRILGIGAALGVPRLLYTGLFQALQRMEINNGLDVLVSAGQQVGTVIILLSKGDLFAVVEWLALTYFISVSAYFLIASRFYGLDMLLPGWKPSVIRKNSRYGGNMMAISVLSMIHTNADRVIVSKLLPVANVGYYSFISTIVARASIVPSAIVQAGFPDLASRHRLGERTHLIGQYEKLQELVIFATAIPYAAIAFGAYPALSFLFNAQIGAALVVPAMLLCIGFYLNATLGVPYIFSLVVGRPDIARKFNVIALFISTPLTVLLVVRFGLTGAAMGWVAYNLMSVAYVAPRIARECLVMPAREWFRHAGRALSVVLLTYGVSWTLMFALRSTGFVPWVAGYLVATAALVAATFALIGQHLRGSLRRLPGVLAGTTRNA